MAANANYNLTYVGGTLTIKTVQANDAVNFNPATPLLIASTINNGGSYQGPSPISGGVSNQQYLGAASDNSPYPSNKNPAPGIHFGVN